MNYALLLLAGSSERFKSKIAKQFYLINKKPIYYYPLKVLNSSKDIDKIILLTLKDKILDVQQLVNKYHFNKVKIVIAGGNSRSETVKIGLNVIKKEAKDNDIVLIHDAVRPLLDCKIIHQAICETKKKQATTFVINSYDTLIECNSKKQITKYLDRNQVFLVQTPQTFMYRIISDAYKNFKICNDDTELVFLAKKKVYLLKGNKKLFKITNIEDVKRLRIYVKNMNI